MLCQQLNYYKAHTGGKTGGNNKKDNLRYRKWPFSAPSWARSWDNGVLSLGLCYNKYSSLFQGEKAFGTGVNIIHGIVRTIKPSREKHIVQLR